MPAKQKSADKFLIPCPRYVKKCSGRLVLYPAIALVQSRRCEGNPVVESVIQKEIAERLGLKHI